jgi:hypothetical protein
MPLMIGRTALVLITIFNAVVLLIFALPVCLMSPIFALFGLPAYGSVLAKIILCFYLLAGLTWPVFLIAGTAAAWVCRRKNKERGVIISLVLSSLSTILFAGSLVFLIVLYWDHFKTKLNPETATKIIEVIKTGGKVP